MENTTLNRSQHTSGGATSQFKFEFLKHITNNFSEDRIIGCGAYGVVYKGVMDNGETIAVKKLNYMPPDRDNEKQFHNECINHMRVQHQNIVRLVGYCDETYRRCVKYKGEFFFVDENERALCFEYLQGGSLDKYVSDEPCRLDWDICFKIIKGVCVGLNHLHNGYKESIFHLDLKPSSILLDNNMIPKIRGFGFSGLFSTTGTCTTTIPLGTIGFVPPEYIDKQEVSQKFDVFSLGVVIIHILAGRKHYYDHVYNPSKIIAIVSENWEKRLHATMWSHVSQEVKTCIKIGLRCVKSDPHERPTISKIVDNLHRSDIAKLSLTYEASNLASRDALDYSQYTTSVPMGVHDNATWFDPMGAIEYIPAMSEEAIGDDRSAHNPMDYVHESIMRDPLSRATGGHASRAISQPRDVTQTTEVDILDIAKLPLTHESGSTVHHMPFQHLKDITNNFSNEEMLGRGGFGVVYKGVLGNGKVVAVKRLVQSLASSQVQFENEVNLLMNVKHPNIVQLVGYCYETQHLRRLHEGKFVFAWDTQCLLCLEFMPNGSLDKYISDASSGLRWPTRRKIIEGISYGLQYLHEQSDIPIIHFDLKPANVLLDENMIPKITDFGLSRLFDQAQTIHTAITCGTLGYMPPEYIRGIITPMSDIFSLGVLIMEVITGHRDYPYDIKTSSVEFIELEVQKWRNVLQKEPGYTSLETDCQQIKRYIQTGLICVNPERTRRPTMKKIIDLLHGMESMNWYISNELSSHDSKTEL